MKRKTIFFSLGCTLACAALGITYVAVAANGIGQRVKGTDDFYSITINPADVTSSTEYVNGSFSTYTDQLHNPINLKFDQAGVNDGVLYLLGNEEGKIYNYLGENSEIRGMNSITIKGNNTNCTIEWGFQDGESIDYINENSDTITPEGIEFSFGSQKPNYFLIKSGSMSPTGITQIIIKYGVECEVGANPKRKINGIRYGIRNDDHWAVEGFVGPSFANVVLEEEIEGLPVSEIWTNAFSDDTVIESINLDHITSIRYSAFYRCSNLANIGDYSNVAYFEGFSFYDCDALTGTLSFTAPSITFSNSAFSNCDGITAVRFEDGCAVSMNYGTFRNMNELVSVYYGDSVSYSDDFCYCPKLASITVSEDNAQFMAVDNVLYQKYGDELTLIRMAEARPQTSYVMPDEVTFMNTYCCHGCSTLETIVIGNNVEEIADSSFDECHALRSVDFGGASSIGSYTFGRTALTTVTIPSTINQIKGRAFVYCDQLTSVVFEEGCTKIAHEAFYGCDLLSTLVLPASLDYPGYAGGYGTGCIVDDCPSLAAICTRLTSGEPAHADPDWLGDKTLLHYSAEANNDGAHWHEVGSNNAPRIWSEKLYIQSNAEFSGDGAWYAVWAWTKGQTNGAFYYDNDAPVNYLYSISVPSDRNCFIVLRMKGGIDASVITSFPDGQFFNRTDDLEDVLANQITITQWDNGMGGGNLGVSYSLYAAA